MRAGDDSWRNPRGRQKRAPKPKTTKTPRSEKGAIKGFVRSRKGVEAYVEPRTLDQPLSVVLVAADGEWLRFTLPDDSWLRRFAHKRPMPIYDVGLVGYPKRMREYRRGGEDPSP